MRSLQVTSNLPPILAPIPSQPVAVQMYSLRKYHHKVIGFGLALRVEPVPARHMRLLSIPKEEYLSLGSSIREFHLATLPTALEDTAIHSLQRRLIEEIQWIGIGQ